MLKEIWRSQPIPYATEGSPDDHRYRPGTIWDYDYNVNKKPYLENLVGPSGVFMQPSMWPHNESAPTAAGNLLCFAQITTSWWPMAGLGYYRFDPVSGKYLKRMQLMMTVGNMMIFTTSCWRSRGGRYYFGHIWSTGLVEVSLGKSATELLPKEDPKSPDDTVSVIGGVGAGHFGLSYMGGPLGIDDIPTADPFDKTGKKTRTYFLMASGGGMKVYNWLTGKWYYDISFPTGVADIAMEDPGRCYILLENRVVFLFDYIRNEVMGMSKLPPKPEGAGGTRITWDPMYRRLLLFEITPNEPSGKSTTCIRGYRMLPQPVRLTKPIPLIKPRQRRVVPFLVQALGELNEGIGGYSVEATVTGAGSLVGIPLTDHVGNAIINVACKGSFVYDSTPDPDPDHDADPASETVVPTFKPCTHTMALMIIDNPENPDPFVFCTLNDPNDDLDTRVTEAQEQGKPLMGYVDGGNFNFTLLEQAEAACITAGVRFLPALMFYPNAGETPNAYIARISGPAGEMHTRWPDDWGAWFATYLQYRGPSPEAPDAYNLELQQVLDCWVAWHNLALQYKARWTIGFSWMRPFTGTPKVDGVVAFPELQEAWLEQKAAVPTRLQWPTQDEALTRGVRTVISAMNGWWPRLTISGGQVFMAYGNGDVRVAELDPVTGEVLRDEFPTAPGVMLGVNWITPTVVTAFYQSAPNQAVRYELDVTETVWAWVSTGNDPALGGGNEYAAAGGHWASILVTNPARLTIDDAAVPGSWYMRLAMAEGDTDTWLTVADAAVAHVKRTTIGGAFEEFPIAQANYHEAAIAGNGAVIYGSSGPTRGITPDGEDVDLSVTPWGVEYLGVVWVGSDSKTWVATWGYSDEFPAGVVFIRPWGEVACVQLLVGPVTKGLSIIESGANWIVAWCNDQGRSSVNVVAKNTPRVALIEGPSEGGGLPGEGDGETDSVEGSAGIIKIDAKIKVYQPDLKDLPALGFSPLTTGGGLTPQPAPPGPPAEGTSDHGPNEAPNMEDTVKTVYASRTWNFANHENDQTGADGRGAFTEAVVVALHDRDARFGFVLKPDTGTRYHNHAVDAVAFKNDDGKTMEIIDIATSSGPMWLTYPREPLKVPNEYNAWTYPCPKHS